MNFYLHRPSGYLGHFIESLVFFEGYTPAHRAERLLPDGFHDLVIDLTERPKFIFENTTLEQKQKCTGAWLSGARKELITIDAGGVNSSMLVVRFHYGAAYHFTRFPVAEITDRVTDTDLMFGREIGWLRERVLEAPDAERKFGVVEDFFSKWLLKEEVPPVVSYAVEALQTNPSERTIGAIAERSGYSQKHFIHLFKKYVGLTPKGFQKIQRFQRVLVEIERTSAVNWTRLALDCGYFDQAHFINEFRRFSGFNPEHYLREHQSDGLLNYVPVGGAGD